MTIKLDNVGRRFNREWIFRGLNFDFLQGHSYAILGNNGSGKSTLLQVLLSSLEVSQGKVSYSMAGKEIEASRFYHYVSFASPYMELIEEFTLQELIHFHFKFKKMVSGLNTDTLIDLLGLTNSANKEIRYFSSGMKQRTKLALAFCSDTPALFLDEPTSNLDKNGFDWYREMIGKFTDNRLVVVCSNQSHEYDFCASLLHISDYK
nr:ATP-binding cassette domain-containing protein [Olivibacter sitiensis]